MLEPHDGQRKLLHDVVKKKKKGLVTLGDGKRCRILGKCKIGKNPHTIIDNVNLVEGLAHNLLSVAQLCSIGYKVVFEHDNVFIMQGDEIIFKDLA